MGRVQSQSSVGKWALKVLRSYSSLNHTSFRQVFNLRYRCIADSRSPDRFTGEEGGPLCFNGRTDRDIVVAKTLATHSPLPVDALPARCYPSIYHHCAVQYYVDVHQPQGVNSNLPDAYAGHLYCIHCMWSKTHCVFPCETSRFTLYSHDMYKCNVRLPILRKYIIAVLVKVVFSPKR